jgi:hypothetical protein
LGFEQITPQGQPQAKPDDLTTLLHHALHLTDAQKAKVDAMVQQHEHRIREVLSDTALNPKARDERLRQFREAFVSDVNALLTPPQKWRLHRILRRIRLDGTVKSEPAIDLISIGYESYFPSSGRARDVFGDSSGSFYLSLSDFEFEPDDRVFAGVGIDTLSLYDHGNDVFVVTPDLAFEYRVPVTHDLSLFGDAAVGPSYMDYSYNTPSGAHFGAKRLGADGRLGIGIRYARVQLAASYRAFTEPADLNFDGLQLSLTWIAVRF